MIEKSEQNQSDLQALRERYTNTRIGPYYAWNKVSRTQIWQWCTAMGDTHQDYLNNEQAVAPPTMLQCWTFRDLNGNYAPGSTDQNAYEVLNKLDDLGYVGSVAVSYDQRYHRYLREGDHVHSYSTIQSISELKKTGLGEGFFVTEFAEYFDQDEILIGDATITYLKYQVKTSSAAMPDAPRKIERIPPVENHDSQHFWQGLRDGKLLIQQCSNCQTHRHPPQPMCEACQSLAWHTVESSGKGTIYSFTTLHHPEIPPFDYPNSIVLVDLDEDVRIAAQLVDCKPNDIDIGRRVVAQIEKVQEGLSVPIFRIGDPEEAP